jgi:SpoVK/Ycf46/Vps4 family AAA+-type ATPase
MDHLVELKTGLSHLARVALVGRHQDVQALIRRFSRRFRSHFPDLSAELDSIVAELPTPRSPFRSATAEALPVDTESRLQLARHEYPVVLDTDPIWDSVVRQRLEQVVTERSKDDELREAGLCPTKSILFTGPPGVGKTLSARWLASKLDRPLLTLDLSAVMSSFLGRTGSNVRNVLDYAKGLECVLLLDELDAVAKRRDDAAEVGELKRLVTVLLQEIDDWPPTGILVAATNHPDLLDPAIWRRFDMVIDFQLPSEEQVTETIIQFFSKHGIERDFVRPLAVTLNGMSYSVIERELLRARRDSVVNGIAIRDRFIALVKEHATRISRDERIDLANQLRAQQLSQREISELTGIHRQTLRRHAKQADNPDKRED